MSSYLYDCDVEYDSEWSTWFVFVHESHLVDGILIGCHSFCREFDNPNEAMDYADMMRA